MAEWPATLPADFLVDGFVETAPDNVIASQPDVGPPKTRRRQTAAMRRVEGVVKMTTAQVAIHDTFFTTTLFDGADPFDWTDPRSGANVSFLYFPHSPPVYAPAGGDNWQVTIKLMRLP